MMKVVLFQPRYPIEGTLDRAAQCMDWMQGELGQLQSGKQHLVLLPEYANAPGLNDRSLMQACAMQQGATFIQFLAASAQRLNCLIAAGLVVPEGDLWFNRTVILDGRGTRVAQYDKIHLTDSESSGLGLTAGSAQTVYRHGAIRIGFATCFDLYFPEHFVALAAQQVDLILCPSYQRSESAARIRTIAQVRALDSGSYLLRSSFAMGTPDTGGHTLIAAPDGTLLIDAGAEAGVVRVDLDPRRKFTKPASHGQAHVEQRALIESHRRTAMQYGDITAPHPPKKPQPKNQSSPSSWLDLMSR